MSTLLTITELTKKDIENILDLSKRMHTIPCDILKHKNILFAFEKPSLRTKVGTEAAINHLGGNVIHIEPSNFFNRESLKDTVQNVAQWCDAIFARVFSHQTLCDMSTFSPIPIVNALCDKHHPMQALADLLTIQEKFGTTKISAAFVGDANNVAFSFLEILLKFGYDVRFAGPEAYFFSSESQSYFKKLAEESGDSILFTTDPLKAVSNAHVIYTDTFISMGEEKIYEEKMRHFEGYQINKTLFSHAHPDAVFMHCLPAHRGVEVTDEIMDSTNSLIYEQAKNRMIVSKGVFVKLLT
ncbi:MAG: ornithine carbamoyltransferase [bacterium]